MLEKGLNIIVSVIFWGSAFLYAVSPMIPTTSDDYDAPITHINQ